MADKIVNEWERNATVEHRDHSATSILASVRLPLELDNMILSNVNQHFLNPAEEHSVVRAYLVREV
jgi:hypothetical protein